MLPYFHYSPKVYNILFKITKKHVKHIATVLYLQTVATCFTCPSVLGIYSPSGVISL